MNMPVEQVDDSFKIALQCLYKLCKYIVYNHNTEVNIDPFFKNISPKAFEILSRSDNWLEWNYGKIKIHSRRFCFFSDIVSAI